MERTDDLDRRSTSWVAAGLISADQREAIRRFEAAPGATADQDRPSRLSLPAEVAVYVGSVFALSGGAMTIASTWDDLAFAGRLAVAVTVAVVGIGVGRWLYSIGEPGTDRVGGYVTSLGVGGVGFVAGLMADELGDRNDSWVGCAAGVAMLVASVTLWRNRDRPLQVLSAALGLGVAATGFIEAVDGEPAVAGLIMIVVGAGSFVAAHTSTLRPEAIVLVAGAVVAYVGGLMLWELSDQLGPGVAVVVALAVVAYGVRFEQLALVVLGILGATIATTALLAETFDGAVSAAVVALLGLALVVVVVGRSLRDRGVSTPVPPPSPPPSPG